MCAHSHLIQVGGSVKNDSVPSATNLSKVCVMVSVTAARPLECSYRQDTDSFSDKFFGGSEHKIIVSNVEICSFYAKAEPGPWRHHGRLCLGEHAGLILPAVS